jgi:hypothetical protein
MKKKKKVKKKEKQQKEEVSPPSSACARAVLACASLLGLPVSAVLGVADARGCYR